MKKIIVLLLVACVLTAAGCAGPSGPSASPSASVTPSASPSPSTSPSPTASPSPSPTTSTSPSPSAGPSGGDYFPFVPNLHRTYLGSGNEYAGFDSWVDYISGNVIQLRTNNTGTESVVVYKLDGGALTAVFQQGETYYVYDYTAMNTMSDVLIMEPIAVGTTWTLASGDQRTITDTDASVTVPYGSYTGALEVTTTFTDSVIKEYYAVGVGLIKRVFESNNDPGNPIVSELAVYETNTPFTQTVRFYYPDFNNSRIVNIDQNGAFYTNDIATPIFDAAFKTVPDGSGLTPLMSASTVLYTMTYDADTAVAAVDFSMTFITQMNAGSALESMIVGSVADTVGTYFMTDRVQITIDGDAYESGHLVYGPGEYPPYNPAAAVPYNP